MKRANKFTREDVVRANKVIMRTGAKKGAKITISNDGHLVRIVESSPTTDRAVKPAIKLTPKEINRAYAEARKLLANA